MSPDDPRHGTNAGHNAGCRCRPCGDAKLRYDKRRRYELHSTGQRRVVPSYRAVRRIHALQALGYSVRVIAETAGLDTKTLYDTSLERSAHTWRRNFEPLAEAYERLAGTVPTGHYAARTRRYAQSKGWPPPLAWDDIDDPDEQPTSWEFDGVDRLGVLEDILDRGGNTYEACRVLGLSRDSLHTWCSNNELKPLFHALAANEVTRLDGRLGRGAALDLEAS